MTKTLARGARTSRACTVPGCSRPHEGHGYCNMHYLRWKKYGEPGPADAHTSTDRLCQVADCGRRAHARSLCSMHYQRWQVTGDPGPTKPIYGRGHVSADGYRIVKLKGRNAKEHRIVMAQRLGRELRPDEYVHHQRVQDLVAWARTILGLYGDTYG